MDSLTALIAEPNNDLTGPLPSELANLNNLQQMRFYHSGLSGTIPPEFASMTQLKELNLENNAFAGAIPSSFLQGAEDKAVNITVSLGFNNISGTIPETLEKFDKLDIKLEGNHIMG